MRRTFVLLIAAALLFSLAPWSTAVVADGPAAPIRLKAVTFTPALGQKPDIPPGLAVAAAQAGVNGYYLVQFSGPVEAAWKDALAGLGVDLLAYVPDYAFKVRMTPAQARQAARLDHVAWVGDFHPAYKLSPDLVQVGMGLYSVRVERGANAGLARAAVAATGAQVLSRQGSYLRLLADGSQLAAIARVLDVAWVQNLALQEKHNEYAAGVIMGATVANNLGYDGSTQIVAIGDTGIGGGTASTAHADIPSTRIAGIVPWTYPDSRNCYDVIQDGAVDVDSGHGTHVAGSVLSDGGASGEGKGTAPAARLYFQAVEEYVDFVRSCASLYPDGYYLMGIPDNIGDLFQAAYNAGARIHSDSWGHDAAGDYDLDAANADDFVWNHPDFVITTSAGNAGIDANGDGYVDLDSMGSPATAKNILTVGASENARADSYPCDADLDGCSGQNTIFTYGEAWGSDYPANPVAGDPSAGNAEQLAAFSSRGPTDDGRIKPDVVAPGTWVLSGYSDLYQAGYDGDPVNPRINAYQYDGWGYPLSKYYKYMGGTSMSNPLTAGGAAVVRDYYNKAHGHSASAALVKATLIHSAVDLLDENNDGQNDNDYPIPNAHEGWGRVNLAAATEGSAQFVDNTGGLNTGGTGSYLYTVASAGQPFKVSLAWSDYPSTESASLNLVNNLNLKVTSPGGAIYWGNVFSGGWSLAGGSADAVNNVENVYVQSAAAGTWTVEVIGANVPQGPQPYALVVDGAFGAVDNPPSVSIVNPTAGSTVSGSVAIQIEATDVEDAAGTLAVEWNVGDGAWQSTTYSGGLYVATWDSTAVGDGAATINARATDSASKVGSDSNGVTVDNVIDPPAVMYVADIAMQGLRAGSNRYARATVTIHEVGGTPVAGAIVYGTWSGAVSGSASGTTLADGTVAFTSAKVKSAGTFAFSVTNVVKDGYTYDPALNVETSDSIYVP